MEKWIERQRNIIDFTLSSLLRRKGKNVALICVYTFVVFMLASVMFFVHSIKREASIILKDAPEMIIQRMIAGRHELIPISYIDKIKDIRGVSSVKRRLWGYYYDPIIGANYTLMVPEDSAVSRREYQSSARGSQERGLPLKEIRLEFRSYDGKIINLEVKKDFFSRIRIGFF